ncbi:MAG: metallophosphoesterase [Bacteroidales bacterium]|nr:metallophosphoesterase [Bacteroidales bacterium]
MKKIYLLCSAVVALMLLAFSSKATAQEKPLITFACVSDLHAQQDFITNPNNIKIRESAIKTFNKIKAEEDIDLIVLGGDYTSNNTIPQSSWQITKDLLIEASRNAFNGTKTPVIYVNGNHEYEVANYDAIPKPYNAGDYYDVPMKTDIGALAEEDCYYETAINGTGEAFELLAAYHYVVKGFDFVVLNGGKYLFETASSYAYSTESVDWVSNKLEEIYATDKDKTVFFLVHIPFSDSKGLSNKNKGMDRYSSTTPEFAVKLKNTLAKYPNLVMLYGHDHGTNSAYIRSATEERVTVYAADGSKYTGTTTGTTTPTTPTTTSTYYIQNYDSKAYLGYNSENLAAVTTQTSDVTFANSTLTSGAFTINLTNAPNDTNGNPREYVHCGSSGRFSGNSANNESGQQIYMYEVANPDAATITGTKATSIESGKTYMIVGVKSGTYYALTDEMYQNNTTNQRMTGAAVTISNNTATYTGSANILWTVNEKSTPEPTPTPTPSPSDKSFFSAFMGSMRYYENVFENGQLADRRIIQALLVYVYADRVELKMKNYGDDQGDVTVSGITVKKELTPYISYRTVTHSEEAVTVKPTVNSTGGDINIGSEVVVNVEAPEWHNLYYTINGEEPTDESAKVENGKIKFTANAEGSYSIKVAAQEGIRLMSETVEVVYNVKETYGIKVSVSPAEGGTAQLSINETEQTVTLTAQAAEGYEFAGWKVGEETISTEISYTTALVENTTYVATFEVKKLNVIVTAGVGGTATVVTEPVAYGSTLTLTATADSGYKFLNWTVNDVEVSTSATFTTEAIKADTEFVANFKELPSGEKAPEYCTPSGATYINNYLKSVTTTGADENISYSATSHPGSTYVLVPGVIKVTPGTSFTINLVANSLGSGSSYTVREDIRYCHASMFTDFDVDGEFGTAVQTWGNKPPQHNVYGNYDECMNITATVTIPEDAPLCRSHVRVIYTNAWGEYPSACTTALDKGIAYDFAVQVYDPETGVEDSENNDIEAYASDGVIYINNYNGVAKVVNIAGQIIKETIVNDNAQIKVGKGIFFVVTEEGVSKVVCY